jgi:hypothetical protein
MQTNNNFQWTDETVIAFVKDLYNRHPHLEMLAKIWDFKKGKQQEASPKEWEILSFSSGYADEQYNHFYTKVEGADDYKAPNGMLTNLSLMLKGIAQIHSVKRLSDGEVFTVGDKVDISGECVKGWDRNPIHTITLFCLNDDKSLSIRCDADIPVYGDIESGKRTGGYMSGSFRIEQLTKAKPILFTTADDKAIREGDTFFLVNSIWEIHSFTASGEDDRRRHSNRFSTEEAAKQYIILNRRVLCLEDVRQICVDNPVINCRDLMALLEHIAKFRTNQS